MEWGGGIVKRGSCIMLIGLLGHGLKKNFFGELGSGTNQLDGVNKMVLIRRTSDLVWIIFHYTAYSGDYFP